MNKELIVKIGKVFVNTDSLVNVTNTTTAAGGALSAVGSVLLSQPEPNLQMIGALLVAGGFLVSLIHTQK